MFLTNLKDNELLEKTKNAVELEREASANLLEHLKEIYLRKLHISMGYGNFMDFLKHYLNISESAAWRRCSVIKMSVSVPEVIEKIESGALNLSNVAMVNSFITREAKNNHKYSQAEKENLLHRTEHKSRREVEQLLVAISPASATPEEQVKLITEEIIVLKISAKKELLDKISRLKELFSNKGGFSTGEIFEKIADMALEKLDPEFSNPNTKTLKQTKKGIKANMQTNDWSATQASAARQATRAEQTTQATHEDRVDASAMKNFAAAAACVITDEHAKAPAQAQPNIHTQASTRTHAPNWRPYISIQTKQEVLARARHSCEYVDPKTGKRCCSRWKLQIEHVTPYALGGASNIGNLKLFCQAHNLYAAEQIFGEKKINRYMHNKR